VWANTLRPPGPAIENGSPSLCQGIEWTGDGATTQNHREGDRRSVRLQPRRHGWGAWFAYQEAPPIPEQVVGPDGETVVTESYAAARSVAFYNQPIVQDLFWARPRVTRSSSWEQ